VLRYQVQFSVERRGKNKRGGITKDRKLVLKLVEERNERCGFFQLRTLRTSFKNSVGGEIIFILPLPSYALF
jgi:hypothetical protein